MNRTDINWRMLIKVGRQTVKTVTRVNGQFACSCRKPSCQHIPLAAQSFDKGYAFTKLD